MIVFIIPFISKQTSFNWELSMKLLQGTIDSLANQNNQKFKVIISCHEIPKVDFRNKNDNFIFLQMDYSPQDKLYQGKPRRDRMVKVCRAVHSLKNTDFQYCMSLDADDRVHL